MSEAGRNPNGLASLRQALDERTFRLVAAAAAQVLGHGGVKRVAAATDLARSTITRGLREISALQAEGPPAEPRVRRQGGGRKPLAVRDPTLERDLEALFEPAAHAGPPPVRWTTRSLRALTADLQARGHQVSQQTLMERLHQLGFRLQGKRRPRPQPGQPDPERQLRLVLAETSCFLSHGWPVAAVASAGTQEEGPELAGEALQRWWRQMGRHVYPRAGGVLVVADLGGTDRRRGTAWRAALAAVADEIGLPVTACHFPPCTSRWSRVDHVLRTATTHQWGEGAVVTQEISVTAVGNPQPAGRPVSGGERAGWEALRQAADPAWLYALPPGTPVHG
jgi:hypothetical protein